MIISNSKKFIFIHIPKCGGSSITKALIPYMNENDIVLGFTNAKVYSCIKNLPSYLHARLKKETSIGLRNYTRIAQNCLESEGNLIVKHSTSSEVRKFIGKDNWNDYYVFSFVRNPWDMILSLYFWYNKVKWTDLKGVANKVRDLPDFTGFLKSGYLPKSCSSYVYEEGQKNVDYIGKMEEISIDFKYVCNKINVPEIELPWNNKTIRERNYRGYYTNETKDIIEKLYEDDIKNFNYNF